MIEPIACGVILGSALLLLSITVLFGTDTLFIRTKSTVGAQSAQWQIADPHRCGHLHRAAMIDLG
jgi:hypothetical protein